MNARTLFRLLRRRWPPLLARHRPLVHHYLADLRLRGFGHRQILFISSNIAAFLDSLRRRGKPLDQAGPQDLGRYFRQAPYNLANDHGKARRTYLLRFLAFALPHRAQVFRVPPRYQPLPDPFGTLGRDFLDFCDQHRGLKDTTRRTYRDHLRSFQALASALKAYLAARPATPHDALFLSVRPPVKPIGLYVRTAVSIRMARHFRRPRSMRVYLLRHSFAKRLLDNGAPIQDIGAVMGHKSLSSTLVYTQVDTRRLREVADNYAALLPNPPGFKPWPTP